MQGTARLGAARSLSDTRTNGLRLHAGAPRERRPSPAEPAPEERRPPVPALGVALALALALALPLVKPLVKPGGLTAALDAVSGGEGPGTGEGDTLWWSAAPPSAVPPPPPPSPPAFQASAKVVCGLERSLDGAAGGVGVARLAGADGGARPGWACDLTAAAARALLRVTGLRLGRWERAPALAAAVEPWGVRERSAWSSLTSLSSSSSVPRS